MRLVIDLQGAQGSSRLRGIGRLSRELAVAMAREAGSNEVLVALSSAFPEATDELMAAFAPILGRDALRVWQPTGRTAEVASDSGLRRVASENVRAEFLRSLVPDLVHVSSLFEGAGDDLVTCLPTDVLAVPSVATLYDLIPLIRRDQYLDGEWTGHPIREWYLRRIEQLRHMPGLLAISESSRQEAITHLGTPPDQVFNIRAGVAPSFRPVSLNGAARTAFLTRYGLPEYYVLFLGGGDLRKNEAGLIAAYGLLPATLRATHRLVIVGKVDAAGLREKAAAAGVAADLILIPFVEEADLPAIYSLCALFVFPSLHEGFGLPAAEAMACGAPVIASDCTSLPEVIGRDDALFDPLQPKSIARLMHHVLTDGSFRASLVEHGPVQAAGFTWADSARRAWSALEGIAARTRTAPSIQVAQPNQRRTLAITSPLPPQHSGIADYTQHLLPALARYYDITLVADDPTAIGATLGTDYEVLASAVFENCAGTFDRVLHQLGNSEFHRLQIDRLLPRIAGVVVLHDVFLSNILLHLSNLEREAARFRQTLLMTHGLSGVRAAAITSNEAAVQRFPCSLLQIRQSLGVILHSEHARTLVAGFYGPALAAETRIVPTSRELPNLPTRTEARSRLQLPPSATVVATFGGVAVAKMPEHLLAGFAASNLSRSGNAVLAFVGQPEPSMMKRLEAQAKAAGVAGSVVLTQRTSWETYQDWLAAADFAIQLRAGSRGETSAAAADCLAAGLPMIVNAHGALAELPPDAIILLENWFDNAALAAAIDRLAMEPELRLRLRNAARAHAAHYLSRENIAQQYHEAIEAFYAAPTAMMAAQRVLRTLEHNDARDLPDGETLRAIGHSLATTFPMPRPRRLMLDITAWSGPHVGARQQWAKIAARLLSDVAACDRGELLDWCDGAAILAWGEAASVAAIDALADAPAGRTVPGDLLLCPALPGLTGEASLALAAWAHRGGARVVAMARSRDDLEAAETRNDLDAVIVLDEAPDASGVEFADLVRVLAGA